MLDNVEGNKPLGNAQDNQRLGDILGRVKGAASPPVADDVKEHPAVKAPAQNTSPFARLVDDCVTAGLLEAVLPVIPPRANTADHLHKNRGKIPGERLDDGRWCGMVGWQKHVTTPVDVEIWRGWPDAGLCIQTKKLPTLDVDLENAELAGAVGDLIRRRIGAGLLVRTRGSSPRKAFLFRVRGEVWKRRIAFKLPGDDTIHAVDLLGIGQQLVLAGEHPRGEHYGLEAPGLSGRTFHDIPELTKTELDELWVEIERTIVEAGGQEVVAQASSGGARARRDRKLTAAETVMREVARRRHDWVPTLLNWGPGPADNGWRIGADDLGRDLEEDLSVYTDGIHDFGTERQHDAISLTREFGDVRPDGDIEFGGSPEYGMRGKEPYAVVGEPDPNVRRPTEGEAAAWLSRCLGGPAIDPAVTRAEAIPALAAAVGLNWADLLAAEVDGRFDYDAVPRSPEEGGSEIAPASPPSKFRLLTFDEVADTALTSSTRPLVEDLLDQGAMSVLYGESNVGKTFVMMDLAYHVAAGRAWGGRQTEQCSVVYFVTEGSRGAGKRAAALRMKYGPCADFHFVLTPINLREEKADLAPIIELLRKVDRLGLVVIDTLSRALAGGDENSSIDMGVLVRHFDAIRAAAACHVTVVHHTGKNTAKGARGHSLLRAATDTEIEISAGKITVTKQRDLEKFTQATFGLETVVVGRNERGRDVTSCTLRFTEPNETKGGELTPREAVVLDAVRLVLEAGSDPTKGAKLSAIAKALKEPGSAGANRTRGSLNNLVGKNHLVKVGRGAWIPRDIQAAGYFQAIDGPEETPKNLGQIRTTEGPKNGRPQTTDFGSSVGVFG